MEWQLFNEKLHYYLGKLFNINGDMLDSLLIKHDAMIAGGFITFVYSKNHSDYYDGDIDIWIPIMNKQDILGSIHDIKREFEELLKISTYNSYNEYNFINKMNYKQKQNNYYKNIKNKDNNLSDIIYMVKLKNENNKEVQLIFTNQPNSNILKHFDLSFCSIGYNGTCIICMNPELIYHNIGFILNNYTKSKERIIKYQNRKYLIFDNKDSAMSYYENIK